MSAHLGGLEGPQNRLQAFRRATMSTAPDLNVVRGIITAHLDSTTPDPGGRRSYALRRVLADIEEYGESLEGETPRREEVTRALERLKANPGYGRPHEVAQDIRTLVAALEGETPEEEPRPRMVPVGDMEAIAERFYQRARRVGAQGRYDAMRALDRAAEDLRSRIALEPEEDFTSPVRTDSPLDLSTLEEAIFRAMEQSMGPEGTRFKRWD